MKTSLVVLFLSAASALMAQPEKKSVVIGSPSNKPNALLIVNPAHSDQGVLLPQLTTKQRVNLTPASPGEDGLIVFDTSLGAYFYWLQNRWVQLLNDAVTKTTFKSLDPADFVELKSGTDNRHSYIAIFESHNSFITVTKQGRAEILAPVDVPHGASLRELTFYYMDDDSEDLRLRLVRQALNGDSDIILSWQSTGASASVNSQAFQDFNNMEVIDRENYTYRLLVTFENDDEVRTPQAARQRVYGVKIKYEE